MITSKDIVRTLTASTVTNHFKKDCWKWKIDTLLNRPLEEKNKKDKQRKRKRNKEKERKRITSIHKHRLKEWIHPKERQTYIEVKDPRNRGIPKAYYPPDL